MFSIHLREGAKVLVDKDDQQDFEDVLEGKTVEPKGGYLFKQPSPLSTLSLQNKHLFYCKYTLISTGA